VVQWIQDNKENFDDNLLVPFKAAFSLYAMGTYMVAVYDGSDRDKISVADLGCLSRIRIFSHPGSQIPDLGSRIPKNMGR
jgi:hypothetical protein